MKKIILFALALLGIISLLSSCTTSRNGCYDQRLGIGYGCYRGR